MSPRANRDDTESQASAQTPSGEAPALVLDEFSISQLRQFFELLDEWDRKAADKTEDEVATSTGARGAAGGAQR